MKSIVRTIVVLTTFNLAMVGSGLAAEAPPEKPREMVVETPPEPVISEPPHTVEPPALPALPAPAPVEPSPPPSVYRSRVVAPWPIAGRAGRGRVLVIPTAETKEESLLAIWEDMYVMAHIFDKKAKEPRLIRGVFVEFGEFFGRDGRDTEAIYLEGFGALFLMEVDLPISAAPKPEQKETEETEEHVDPTWQQAQDEVFLRKAATAGPEPGLTEYGPEKFEELKKELIRTLKHAANIRSLKPTEWIILTVVGGAQQPVGAVNVALPSIDLGSRQPQPPNVESYGGRGYRAAGGYGGGGFGGGYGVGGYGMGGFGAMGFPSATVLTIRAKKADVDAFAKGEMDFDDFQEHVVVLTYPHLSSQAVGGQPREARSSRGLSLTRRR